MPAASVANPECWAAGNMKQDPITGQLLPELVARTHELVQTWGTGIAVPNREPGSHLRDRTSLCYMRMQCQILASRTTWLLSTGCFMIYLQAAPTDARVVLGIMLAKTQDGLVLYRHVTKCQGQSMHAGCGLCEGLMQGALEHISIFVLTFALAIMPNVAAAGMTFQKAHENSVKVWGALWMGCFRAP